MMVFCDNCGEVPEEECGYVDFGIGPYEFWGMPGVDHNWQFVHLECKGKVEGYTDYEPDQPILDDGYYSNQFMPEKNIWGDK